MTTPKVPFPFSAQLRSSSAKNLLVLTISPATQAKLHCAAVIKCCETATETGSPRIQRAVRVPFDFDGKRKRLWLLKKRWTQVVTFQSLNSKSAMKKECDHVSSPFLVWYTRPRNVRRKVFLQNQLLRVSTVGGTFTLKPTLLTVMSDRGEFWVSSTSSQGSKSSWSDPSSGITDVSGIRFGEDGFVLSVFCLSLSNLRLSISFLLSSFRFSISCRRFSLSSVFVLLSLFPKRFFESFVLVLSLFSTSITLLRFVGPMLLIFFSDTEPVRTQKKTHTRAKF